MKRILFLLLFLSQIAIAETKATKTLIRAIEKNNFILAQNALADGADPTAPLIKATELNRVKIIHLLLHHHANVNVKDSRLGVTPLMVAAHKDLANIAELLIAYGAEVNTKNSLGQNALELSAFKNSLSVMQLLLKQQDIDVNAGSSLCALAVAAGKGHAGAVLLLKKQIGTKASSPNCVDDALKMARKKKHDHIRAILVRDQDFRLRPMLL